jgi:hypothetical protein
MVAGRHSLLIIRVLRNLGINSNLNVGSRLGLDNTHSIRARNLDKSSNTRVLCSTSNRARCSRPADYRLAAHNRDKYSSIRSIMLTIMRSRMIRAKLDCLPER